MQASSGQLLCPGHDSEQLEDAATGAHNTIISNCNDTPSSMEARDMQRVSLQQHSVAQEIQGTLPRPVQSALADHTAQVSHLPPQKPAGSCKQLQLVWAGKDAYMAPQQQAGNSTDAFWDLTQRFQSQVQGSTVVGVPVYHNGVLQRALGPGQPYDGVTAPAQPVLALSTSAQPSSSAQRGPILPQDTISLPAQPAPIETALNKSISRAQHGPIQPQGPASVPAQSAPALAAPAHPSKAAQRASTFPYGPMQNHSSKGEHGQAATIDVAEVEGERTPVHTFAGLSPWLLTIAVVEM
jgi:hypothetical protein